MIPGYYMLDLYLGDSATFRFALWDDAAKTNPTDLTGASVLAEVRDKPGGAYLFELVCNIEPLNTIVASLRAVDWPTTWGTRARAAWDLQVQFPDAEVSTVLAGPVSIAIDVTTGAALAAAL